MKTNESRIQQFWGSLCGEGERTRFLFRAAKFPSVVGEAGWTEPGQRLREDRALKQVGSLGEVRVVILLKVYEPNVRSKCGSRFRSGAPSREV